MAEKKYTSVSLSNFADINFAINKAIMCIESVKDYVNLMNNTAVDFYSKNDYHVAFYTYTKAFKTITNINSAKATEARIPNFVNEKNISEEIVRDYNESNHGVSHEIKAGSFDIYHSLNNETRLSEAMKTSDTVTDSLELLSIFLLNLSLIYYQTNLYNFTELVVDKSLKIIPETCNTRVKLALLNIKGCLKYRKNKMGKALQYFVFAHNLKFEDFSTKVNNGTEDMSYSNNLRGIVGSNIGRVHFKNREYMKAVHACKTVVETYLTFLDDRHENVCVGMYNLGLACEAAGELGTAIECFEYFLSNCRLETHTLLISNKHLVTILLHILKVLGQNSSLKIVKGRELMFYLEKANDAVSLGCFEHSMMPEYLKVIGTNLLEMTLYEIALPFFLEQLRIEEFSLRRQHSLIAETLITIGLTYLKLDILPQALEYFHRVLNVLNSHENKRYVHALALYNIGFVNYKQEYLSIAWKYFADAIYILKESQGELHSDVAEMLLNIAKYEMEAGRLKDALPKLLESLMISRLNFGNYHSSTLNTMYQIGRWHELQEDASEALNIYQQILSAYSTSEVSGDKSFEVVLFHRLAELSYLVEKQEEAIEAYLEILNIISSYLGRNHHSLASVLQILCGLYAELGMTAKGVETYEHSKKILLNINYSREDSNDPELEEIIVSLFGFACVNDFAIASAAA